MKVLDNQTIWNMARELISQNGAVTNVETKMALRQLDYWATQHEISNAMLVASDVPQQRQFSYAFNGVYRTYFLPQTNVPQAVQAHFVPQPALIPASTPVTPPVKVANYRCKVYGCPKKTYKGMTRSQAKYAYVTDHYNVYKAEVSGTVRDEKREMYQRVSAKLKK